MDKILQKIEKFKSIKFNKTWYFRFKKFSDEKYLLTNDLWYYIFLTKEDFFYFIEEKIEKIDLDKQVELKKKYFLKEKNYEEDLSKLHNLKNSYLKIWPSLHIMVLTLRCNHACKYCHANISNEKEFSKDMSEETAKKIVDTIFFTTSNSITIEFQWGEPLLNLNILKFIIDYSKQKAFYLNKKLSFALVTNLSLMSEEILNYLIENEVSISTSLDGSEEVHNFNRTFVKWNSFEKVSFWIKKINEEYQKRWIDKKIWALSTITKKTLSNTKELVDTYIDLWLDSIFVRPMNPYGFAEKNYKELWYTTQEFNKFYDKIIEYIFELNNKWIIIKEYFTTIFLQKILQNIDPNFVDERSPCWATVWQVAYNYNGKIYTCDEWRMFWEIWDENFLIWNVNTDKKSEEHYSWMIKSDVTKSLLIASEIDALPWYSNSVYKNYIWVCPILNYKNNWSIFANYKLDTKNQISTNILDNIFFRIEDKKYNSIFKEWIWKRDYNYNCF